MKLPLFLVLLFALNLTAQERGGSIYLSGPTGATYQSVTDGGSEASSPFSRANNDSGLTLRTYRAGYFVTNRLLVGTRVFYSSFAAEPEFTFGSSDELILRPFARYYFLQSDARPFSVFGELGFGAFTVGRGRGMETDFHLGLGAELSLAPGVLGTANLNYTSNATDLNITDLTVGLSVLTGQLSHGESGSLRVGTLMTSGQLGRAWFGRMDRQGGIDSRLNFNLSPQVGYFVRDRLVIEAAVNVAHEDSRSEISTFRSFPTGAYTDWSFDLGTRYYVYRANRLKPFASAGLGYRGVNESSPQFGSVERSFRSVFYRAGAGASYFLSDKLAIDLAANYQVENPKHTDGRFVGDLPRNRVRVEAGLRFVLPGG